MGIKKENIAIPAVCRKSKIESKKIDVDKRTAIVVFSTGARVKRSGFFGPDFFEELSMKKSSIRMERMKQGAPLLNNHASGSLEDSIGVVEKAWIEDGKGFAKVRFSERESVEPIWKDVRDGIINNISVGYRVHNFQELEKPSDGLSVFRATDWEPLEISLVNIPADKDSQVLRSFGSMDCTIIRRDAEIIETSTDDDTIIDAVDQNDDDTQRSVDNKKQKSNDEPIETDKTVDQKVSDDQRAIDKDQKNGQTLDVSQKTGDQNMDQKIKDAKAAEKKRAKDIRETVRKAGVDSTLADGWIDDDKTADEVRTLVIDKIAEKNADKDTRADNVDATITRDPLDSVKRGVEMSMLHKIGQQKELVDEGREFAFMSSLDLARSVLNAQGINTKGMPGHQVADIALNNKRAGHTTSDFPEILANVANKSLRQGYTQAPRTFSPFTREVTVADFKEISRTQLGEGEALELVPEKSEIKRGTVSEAAEKYSLKTYAKIICFSRQMLINDDLGAFDRAAQMMGRRASDLENDLVWGIINANAAMGDTTALFHADHGNLGTAGVPSDTTLSEMRQLMRSQVGLDGQKISIVPMWIFGPQSLETTMEKLLASITPNSVSTVSPFSSAGRTPLQMGIEPRLEDSSATAWYAMASLDQLDMIELARLEGESGPVIESRNGFDVEGVEIKGRLDVAAKAIDFRGLFKNAGV